jgi:hypothetical protein
MLPPRVRKVNHNWKICTAKHTTNFCKRATHIRQRALPVRGIPMQSLSMATADQSQGHGTGFR